MRTCEQCRGESSRLLFTTGPVRGADREGRGAKSRSRQRLFLG